MKNDKKSVLLYTEWAEPLKSLPLEEKGRIFDAILSYTENGRMPKFENQMIVLIVRILKRTNSRRLQLARPTESRSPTGYGLDAIRCSRLIWPQNSETCGKLV